MTYFFGCAALLLLKPLCLWPCLSAAVLLWSFSSSHYAFKNVILSYFIVFFDRLGELKVSHSAFLPSPPPFFSAHLKTASPIFFCHSLSCGTHHHNQGYCSLRFPPLSFTPPQLLCLSPTFCYLLLVCREKLTPLQIHCSVFFPSYMVISLQISAVSGRVLPTCLDHCALICEAAESLRTAEHASLEWIYALREVQKAEEKRDITFEKWSFL